MLTYLFFYVTGKRPLAIVAPTLLAPAILVGVYKRIDKGKEREVRVISVRVEL